MKLQKLKIEKALRIQFLNHFRYFCSFCRGGLLRSFSLYTIVWVLSIEYFLRCAPGVFPNIIRVVNQYHCLCFVWTKRGGRSLRAAGSHERLGEMWSHTKSKKKQTDIESFFSGCILIHVGTGAERRRSVLKPSVRPPTHPAVPPDVGRRPGRHMIPCQPVAPCRSGQNLYSNLRLESHTH